MKVYLMICGLIVNTIGVTYVILYLLIDKNFKKYFRFKIGLNHLFWYKYNVFLKCKPCVKQESGEMVNVLSDEKVKKYFEIRVWWIFIIVIPKIFKLIEEKEE